MTGQIDTTFDFYSETRKDPDSHSPTLKRYHRLLWSKPLPSGPTLRLREEPRAYLVYRSDGTSLFLTSDTITTRLLKQAAPVVKQISASDMPQSPGYTIGSSILFPGQRINGKMTINGARGCNGSIADRFDLTLECIRRHYVGESSPLADVLGRYTDFFDLFENFTGYAQFFLLQDLLDGKGRVRFFLPFDDFATSPVPQTVSQYMAYRAASNAFIQARNVRIDQLDV